MPAIRQRSQEVAELDSAARRYVDDIDRRYYGGRIPQHLAADVFRQAVDSIAKGRMIEELAPIHKVLVNSAALATDQVPPTPPELQELIDNITAKWTNAVAELLPPAE